MIIVDCERMRHRNTGLFFFCDMVVKSLLKNKKNNLDLGVYCHSALKGRWGDCVSYKRMCTFLDKFYLRQPETGSLWHTTYQLSRYVPSNGKLLLTVHDLNFLYEKSKHKQHKYIARMQKLVDRADRIVAISEYTKNDLMAHVNTGNKKIDIIYNGCNVYDGPIVEPEIKPVGEFIFSVATVLPKKNFHVLPCLLENNDLELIIAGNKSDYENVIMEEAKKFGVENRVKIIGPIDESVKHWYLKNCKAFVFPSIAEGFGLPVIEAMDYGKPVFLSRHTCLPEIGGEYAYYFNRDFDRKLMQKEFMDGLQDFDNGGKSPDDIKKYASRFSWDNAARQYLKIYDEMINA